MNTKFRRLGWLGWNDRFLCAVLACVMILTSLFSGDVVVWAQGEDAGLMTQTASPTDCVYKKDDSGYVCYVGDKVVTKEGWVKVDKSTEAYVGADGYVKKVYDPLKKLLSIYNGADISAATNTESVLSDGYNYLFGEVDIDNSQKAKLIDKKNCWLTLGGNKYYVNANSRPTQKYTRSGDSIRMYTDGQGKGNWTMCRNVWKTVGSDEYYFDGSGICTRSYSRDTKKMKVLKNGILVAASRQIVSLSDGMEYYFDASGIQVKRAGWYDPKVGLHIYVRGSGKVTGKIYKKDGIYRFYFMNASNTQLVMQKNCWKDTGKELYYFSGNGRATVIYNKSSKKLYNYSSRAKKYVTVKNQVCKLNGNRYYFYNSQGKRAVSKGWKKANSTTYYYVGSKGYMTAKYVVKGSTKKLYYYNYSTNKWNIQKNKWRQVDDQKIYFNSKGVATVSYGISSKKGYTLTKGKWVPIKNSIKKISSSNYFFNKKGVRVTKPGVYKTSNGYLAYVNRKGVVYKREYNLEVKRYYTIDLGHGKTTKVYGYYDLGAAKRLAREVNDHRKDNGLAALAITSSLTETATTRAKEISNTYSHYRPNGTLCINSMYELYGENLAGGFSDESLAFRAWTKSPSHERNMLDTSYKTMGVAVFVALNKDKQGYKRYYVLTFGK